MTIGSLLTNTEDDKLGRLKRCKADNDIDNTAVDIILDSGFAVTLDEVGVSRRCSRYPH